MPDHHPQVVADLHSQVRDDLCWTVNSPSLVDGPNVAPPSSIEPSAIDPEHLARFLDGQRQSQRVGVYFEQLVLYWLQHVRGVEVLESGLQLRDGNRTIGEIDFLYRDEMDEIVHAETSVKFFLHAPGAEPSEYPGPNARDNLERKVAKLFDRQLETSRGRIPDVTSRIGLMKGVIFYPLSANGAITEPQQRPERLSANHLRGGWVRMSELTKANWPNGETWRFAVVDKPHWLAPPATASERSLGELQSAMQQRFDRGQGPAMVSVRSASSEPERLRMFVVPDSWPER